MTTFFPLTSASFPSRSIGAISPSLGHSGATGTGGGFGDNHACAVSGRLFADIHLGQADCSTSSASGLMSTAPFLGAGAASAAGQLRASLGIPILRIASFVPRLENILNGRGSFRVARGADQPIACEDSGEAARRIDTGAGDTRMIDVREERYKQVLLESL